MSIMAFCVLVFCFSAISGTIVLFLLGPWLDRKAKREKMVKMEKNVKKLLDTFRKLGIDYVYNEHGEKEPVDFTIDGEDIYTEGNYDVVNIDENE